MSFREKSAWISFFTILLVFGHYFFRTFAYLVENPSGDPFGEASLVGLFFGSIVLVVIVEIVLHIAIAARAPREALAARDERERLVALKATRVAYAVMAVSTILAAFVIAHHPPNPWGVANLALLVFVLAEVVRFGGEILYYRRGA